MKTDTASIRDLVMRRRATRGHHDAREKPTVKIERKPQAGKPAPPSDTAPPPSL
jgi:hypothetical protein